MRKFHSVLLSTLRLFFRGCGSNFHLPPSTFLFTGPSLFFAFAPLPAAPNSTYAFFLPLLVVFFHSDDACRFSFYEKLFTLSAFLSLPPCVLFEIFLVFCETDTGHSLVFSVLTPLGRLLLLLQPLPAPSVFPEETF